MLGILVGTAAAALLVFELLSKSALPWEPSSTLAVVAPRPVPTRFLASSGISYDTYTWRGLAAPGLTYHLAIPVLVSGGKVIPPVPWVSYSNTQSTGLRLKIASGRAPSDNFQQQAFKDLGLPVA